MAPNITSSSSRIREALAFDDVLVVPAYSQILPNRTDTRTRLTRGIWLNIPLLSAAMDTVTEGPMAIAMAQQGGIGVIHKNLTTEEQVAAVRAVKKFESGMVVNPITIHPDVSGRPQVLMMLERLYSHIIRHPGVRFATMDEIADDFARRQPRKT